VTQPPVHIHVFLNGGNAPVLIAGLVFIDKLLGPPPAGTNQAQQSKKCPDFYRTILHIREFSSFTIIFQDILNASQGGVIYFSLTHHSGGAAFFKKKPQRYLFSAISVVNILHFSLDKK
jgi:hypothetical protein